MFAWNIPFWRQEITGTFIVLAAIFCLNVLFYLWSYYGITPKRRKFVKLINMIPGPKTILYFGNTYKFFGSSDFLLQKLKKVAEEYSTPLKLWMGFEPYVVLDDPRDVEIILNHPKCQTKDKMYRFLEPVVGLGLISGSGEYWRKHKKIISPTFHISILEQFIDTFIEHSDILTEKLKKQIDKPPFDIMKYVHSCCIDLVCDTIMGSKLNTQGGENIEYQKSIRNAYEIVFVRMFRIWLHPKWTFLSTSIGRVFQRSVNIIHQFTNEVFFKKKKEYYDRMQAISQGLIHEEGRKLKRRAVFLDLIIELSEEEKVFTDAECIEEMNTLMMAAVDTISSISCFSMLMLGIHQQCQKKVMEELEGIFGDSKCPPTSADLHKMVYLEQVIMETLRLFPIGPILLRKVTDDVRISNYTLPAGCSVALFLFSTQRRPDIFPNPDMFDPENFTPENIEARHPYCCVPYSAGPRKCIGKTYSIMALKILLSTVLRNFKISADMKMEDIVIKGEISVHLVGGYNIRLQNRLKS